MGADEFATLLKEKKGGGDMGKKRGRWHVVLEGNQKKRKGT